jgi:hypothetical protein
MLSSGRFAGVFSLNAKYISYLHAYEDGTECSETLAFKLKTPVNHPEESIQYPGFLRFSAYLGLSSRIMLIGMGGGLKCIHLAQGKHKLRATLNKVINFRVPKSARNFLTT